MHTSTQTFLFSFLVPDVHANAFTPVHYFIYSTLYIINYFTYTVTIILLYEAATGSSSAYGGGLPHFFYFMLKVIKLLNACNVHHIFCLSWYDMKNESMFIPLCFNMYFAYFCYIVSILLLKNVEIKSKSIKIKIPIHLW